MSLRHKGSCVDPQFAAPKHVVNSTPTGQFSWGRSDGNDAKLGVSCSEEHGRRAIASPQSGQDATAAQQRSVQGPPANINFTGTYAPLRCSASSPAVLSLVLQQAMAVADLAQRNLLEYEEGCTLRSCAPDDKSGTGRCGAVHGRSSSATAERMVEPFYSHMQRMARCHGDGISQAQCLEAYAGGHNPIVLSLKNQPVEVTADALNGLDKAPLEPYACTKDLRYFLITPTSTKAEAAQFVASTADTYRQCSLGKHSPAPGSQLFPDAPILPLPCPAEIRTKEQRRSRSTPVSVSKNGGPPLTTQESLKRSLQRESLHFGRHAPSSVAVTSAQGSSARANACHENIAAAIMKAVPAAPKLASESDQPDTGQPRALRRVPFQVPDDGQAVAPQPQHESGKSASPAAEETLQSETDAARAMSRLTDDCAESSVPEWFAGGLGRVCYQLQRRLLLDGKEEFPRRSLRSLHAPAVVVYVVVPSDSFADVSRSLLLCSQALAPCTSLGLEEAQQQCQSSNAEGPDGAELSPPMQGEHRAPGLPDGAPGAYSCKDFRKVAMGCTRPWPSILQSVEACPTNVVLQAITPAMLRDVTTCSVRSTAFAVYNKVALAEQGARYARPRAHTAGHPAPGSQQLQPAAAPRTPGAQDLGNGEMHGSPRFRRRWVGCCAVFPPFKLAQVALGPPIQPPAIEEGQQPHGWLEEFRKSHQPKDLVTAVVPGESPTATKGQGLADLTVLTGKSAGRQMHRSGSLVSQPTSPASASPLPFSDSESSGSQSMSGSRSQAGASVTPKHSCKASPTAPGPMAPGSRVRPATVEAAERPVGEAPGTEYAKAADSDEPVWNDLHVLHCTYTVATADHGRPLVTMAWADAHGELLRQVTDELPLESAGGSGTGLQQDSMMLAWWCAERLIGESFDLMMRPAAAALEHVCVTLVLAEDCEQWVWMHVPQLLAARLRGSAALARQLKRVTVLNVAIDDPTYIRQPQVHWEGADKAGMHIVYPGLRPMFHEHVESRAMQYARLRRTGLHTGHAKPPQDSGAGARTPPTLEGTSGTLVNGYALSPAVATPTSRALNNGLATKTTQAEAVGAQNALGIKAVSKARLVNGMTAALESPGHHVEPSDTWGGGLERAGIDAASATSAQGVPVADIHVSVATVDDQKRPLKGELLRSHSHSLQRGRDGLAARNDVNENGKVSDYDQATAGAEGVPASPNARVRKRGRDGCLSSEAHGAPVAECNAAGSSRGECPATASVLWQPSGIGAELGGLHGHHSPLRAMHVAVLCEWRISRATEDGRVDVNWVDPCGDSVVAAARALHRLAFVHWCHWGFAVQAHRAYVAGGAGTAASLPRVAHWPIHCALAARACRLAQQVLA